MSSDTLHIPGLTVRDLARRYRVGEDKVRAWIKSGELPAVDVSAVRCGKPQFRVTADGLVEFERRRSAAEPRCKQRRRRRQQAVDYYPD